MSLEACLNQTVHDFWPLETKEAGLNQTVHDFGPPHVCLKQTVRDFGDRVGEKHRVLSYFRVFLAKQ